MLESVFMNRFIYKIPFFCLCEVYHHRFKKEKKKFFFPWGRASIGKAQLFLKVLVLEKLLFVLYPSAAWSSAPKQFGRQVDGLRRM